jgi:hypothetical protein
MLLFVSTAVCFCKHKRKDRVSTKTNSRINEKKE